MMPLAPYESGCEITGCDDENCAACGGQYGKPKPPRFTKQGVLDLNDRSGRREHVHRYAPKTYTNRSGRQVTKMVCFCSDVLQETADAEAKRLEEDLCDPYDGG